MKRRSRESDTPRQRDTGRTSGAVLGASLPRCVAIVVVVLGLCPAVAQAQSWGVRGTVDAGVTMFTASESFTAIFDRRSGSVIGGGGEVVLPQHIFAAVRVSRFQATGQRVFIFEGETFDLGIETTVRIVPVELSVGYRFGDVDRRVVPFVGAGLGWHRYQEVSEFAEASENVNETYRGYHVLGGAEVRLARWLAIGGEFQWTTVPDALGGDPNSVSAEFGEDNLGGTAARVKFVVGR